MKVARTSEIATWCAVLGVSPEASEDVIRAAGKAILKRNHPDHADDETDRQVRETRSKQVTEATTELCDIDNRPLWREVSERAHDPRPSPGSSDAQPYDTDQRRSAGDEYDDDSWQRTAAPWSAAGSLTRVTIERAHLTLAAVTALAWMFGASMHSTVSGSGYVIGGLIAAAVVLRLMTAGSASRVWPAAAASITLSMVAPTSLVLLAFTAVAYPWLDRTLDGGGRPQFGQVAWVVAVWLAVAGLVTSPQSPPPMFGWLIIAGGAVATLVVTTVLGSRPATQRQAMVAGACAGALVLPAAFLGFTVWAAVIWIKRARNRHHRATLNDTSDPT